MCVAGGLWGLGLFLGKHAASDTDNLCVSALDKVAEFRRLRYPLGLLRKACAYLAATSGVRQWLDVRDTLR